MLEWILIIALAVMYIQKRYTAIELREFTKFLQDENRVQRTELRRSSLQLNDNIFFLERMTDELDLKDAEDREANAIRLKKKLALTEGNRKLIEAINNLN